MTPPFPIDRLSVRRFLLGTQYLLSDSIVPSHTEDTEVTMGIIRSLECVQLDPVSAVERNQHLVLAARNPNYRPDQLNQLLTQGKVFEYIANAACVIPMEDYPIVEPIRERVRARVMNLLQEMDPVVQVVLTRLKEEGSLPSRAFRSTKRVHGYWDNIAPKTKDTSLALNLLLDAGIIRVVCREGLERFFGLTEKTVHTDELRNAENINPSEAKQALLEKYMRAYRVFDIQDPRFGWQKITASEKRAEIERLVQNGTVIPLQVEGVKRQYYILADDLDRLQEMERTTKNEGSPDEGPIRFLPPLDNLLWRRERLVDFFDFDYKWEIYIPESKRRYGYYAMPILCGDRLIGRLDPRLDRKGNRLIVRLLQLDNDVQVTPQLLTRLHEALESFAKFHGVNEFVIEKMEPEALEIYMPLQN
jgi:uncharacterized protein YcaQ